MKKSLKLLTAMSLLSALLLTACGPDVNDPNASNDEGDTIKIGAIIPLTGDGADLGLPLQKVAQIAIDKVNEEGGVNGKELEFIWEDGKCTSGTDAASAAQKLINVDKVQIIYGGVCSPETLAAAPIAEKAGVVMLSPSSSSPEVTNAGDYIFRNYPSDNAQGTVLAEIAKEQGFNKVAIITEENDYTIGLEDAFTENFVDDNHEIVNESYLTTDTDFKTQITKLTGESPDAIFINPQTPNKADLLLKQLSEANVELPLMGNDVVLGYKEGLERYPELVEGMLGAEVTYNSGHPDFIYFSEEYKTQTGEDSVPYVTYAATFYDAVMLIAEGVEEVGYDADAFRDWLYAIDGWEGTSGTLTLDENGDPKAAHVPKVVKNGEVMPYEGMNAMEEDTQEETTDETTE